MSAFCAKDHDKNVTIVAWESANDARFLWEKISSLAECNGTSHNQGLGSKIQVSLRLNQMSYKGNFIQSSVSKNFTSNKE